MFKLNHRVLRTWGMLLLACAFILSTVFASAQSQANTNISATVSKDSRAPGQSQATMRGSGGDIPEAQSATNRDPKTQLATEMQPGAPEIACTQANSPASAFCIWRDSIIPTPVGIPIDG